MKYNQVEPHIDKEDVESVSNYLSSGAWITEHKVTKNLEDSIKNFIGRDYCVSVPNGTIAIYLSLLASGITDGKKVAVPNLTMIATINAVLWAKAEPVLIDVDESLCMSYEELVKFEDLDAVIFVPLNGRSGEGEKIFNWCKDSNIRFIEDSAHALGSSYKNTKCGSLGDLSIISFTPHKIITMGQGGMILTDNQEYYDYLLKLKTFNRLKDKNDWHEGFGLNFKITDLQASLGLSQFNKLEEFILNKKNNYKEYKKSINEEDTYVLDFKNHEVPWFFDLKISSVTKKNELVEHLIENEIETRNLYPALSKQEYLNKYANDRLNFSEEIFDKIIWLPSSNKLNQTDVGYISQVINSF